MVLGLFLLWMGLRSTVGHETTTEHLYGGQFETITCDGGKPVLGKGIHLPAAAQACSQERDSQRRRAPWLVLGGLVVSGIGINQLRKARS